MFRLVMWHYELKKEKEKGKLRHNFAIVEKCLMSKI